MFQSVPEPQQAPTTPTSWLSYLPIIFEIVRVVASLATIVLAIVNLLFAIYIFWRKERTDKADKRRDIHIAAFKNLILDYTLDNFYAFFANLETIAHTLTDETCSDDLKKSAEAGFAAEQIEVRRR